MAETNFDPKTYTSDEGGGFGGYATSKLPDVGVTMKEYDEAVAEAQKKFKYRFDDVDPAELQRLSQLRKNVNGAMVDAGDELRLKAFRGEALTPTEQYYLHYTGGVDNSIFPRFYQPEYGSGGSPTGWKKYANTMGGASDIDAYQRWYQSLLNGTPSSPQSQPGGMGVGNVGGGGSAPSVTNSTPSSDESTPSWYGGASTSVPASAAPAATTSVASYQPKYVTPQFYTPQAVAAQLGTSAPAAPAATDKTTGLLEQAITSMLTGQGGYSQELLAKLRDTGRGELQAQYEEASRQLEGEMARRGIAASSIALERSSGLKGSNQRALASFETELAKQVEDAVRSDRQAGIQSALTLRNQQQQESQFAQQFAESQRQWDANFGLNVAQFNTQAAQWAATYNLDQDKFAEATRQFNTSLAEQQRQFGLSYDLQSKQFEQQAKQFALAYGLDQQKFYESVKQFNASQAQQQSQFNQSFGLDKQKFEEAQKQFQQSLEMQKRQIITQIITGLQGKVDQATLEAILRSFNIDPTTIFGAPKSTTSNNSTPPSYTPNTGGNSNNSTGRPTNIGVYDGERQTVNGVTWAWDASTQTWKQVNE